MKKVEVVWLDVNNDWKVYVLDKVARVNVLGEVITFMTKESDVLLGLPVSRVAYFQTIEVKEGEANNDD